MWIGIARWLTAVGMGGLLLYSQAAESLTPPGFRPTAPGTHALVGARVYTQPGTVFSNATVVIREGRILAVGPEVTPPPDARIWDYSGKTLYPGFIDPYLTLGNTNSPVRTRSGEAMAQAGADARSSDVGAGGYRFFGVPGQERDPGNPGPGSLVSGITPEHRMSERWSPEPKSLEELRELGFTAANVVPTRGIIRGQSAMVTLGDGSPGETLLATDPNRGTAQHIAFEVPPGEGTFPGSLMGVLAAIRQAFLDAEWWFNAQTAFSQNPKAAPRVPFNNALQALQQVRSGQPVIFEPGSILMVDRARRLAQELGIASGILVASGEEWRRPDLIEPAATPYIVPLNFPALPHFPQEEDWDGVSLESLRAWDWAPENPALLRRLNATIALTTHGLGTRKEFRENLIQAIDRGLSETDALAALTLIPARFCQMDTLLGSLSPGKLAHLTVCDAKGYFDPEGKVLGVWIDGRLYESAPTVAKTKKSSTPPKNAEEKPTAKKTVQRDLKRKRVAQDAQSGRGVLASPPAFLIRNATLWTCGPQGILKGASLLVRNGRIAAIGNIQPEPGVEEWDGTGLHITPGLIDAHSHSMILGSVNEATLPSTAMVRIGDVVHSETPHIHQQLAGGLTVANLLHGSANPIGGQNQVIKLREGAAPEALKFSQAPQGIKFALGENVKQSNWGEKYTTRFPQSRMGVPAFFQNRFTAAQQYAADWKQWRQGGQKGVAPRRDLELEALVEILEGQRLIHCHSYRQDEIVVFLRTMESFGIRVASLQHVLEGYKVADEIALHGAGGSSFADWWSYKFEVIDAIPYNGSLMQARGVTVSFNSDSDDHARRLNFEAAKAVKYGNTPEEEALKFVTLNPARQLRIDRWVGSLEPGKDADWAVWSGSPLDSSSRCLQTWIEGKKYFDRTAETARVQRLQDERTALLAKARKVSGDGGEASASETAREKFFRRSLETATHLGVQNCQDCLLPRRN